MLLPLGLLDHSGITMYVGGGSHWIDSQGWDSGTVGFIYDTKKGREECGTDPEHVEACLRGEVQTYDDALTGNVRGYVVEDAEGEHVDSCWGFYGYDYAVEEMARMLDGAVAFAARHRVKVARGWAIAHGLA